MGCNLENFSFTVKITIGHTHTHMHTRTISMKVKPHQRKWTVFLRTSVAYNK